MAILDVLAGEGCIGKLGAAEDADLKADHKIGAGLASSLPGGPSVSGGPSFRPSRFDFQLVAVIRRSDAGSLRTVLPLPFRKVVGRASSAQVCFFLRHAAVARLSRNTLNCARIAPRLSVPTRKSIRWTNPQSQQRSLYPRRIGCTHSPDCGSSYFRTSFPGTISGHFCSPAGRHHRPRRF
jgi:hypothetical protein